MKAIVTGGAGFIGSHLVDALINHGAKVHVLDNLTTGHMQNVHSSAVLHIVDIRSEKAREIILHERPSVIFHMAAQADVSRSLHHPLDDADVNINGTINVLSASHEASVKKVIFASTSAVYGSLQKDMIFEGDMTKPISYYGLSKLTAEAYLRLFSQLNGTCYTILRYGNVYGPRQLAKGEGGVIAIFLDKLKAKEPLIIHGDGEQTRDFVYVKDVVQANILAMNRGHQKIIHISTSQSTSINQLVKFLKQIHRFEIDTIYKPSKIGDIKHSCLNNMRAHQLLKWRPTFDIIKGIKETYDSF